MALKIYNTMSGQKEEFIPIQEGKVGMYVCGVTVYDLCHIGHARSVIVFDTIYRYFKYKGYKVTFVRNFTDIDDKIIKRANEEGVDYKTISERYIREFYSDMASLGLERPTFEPKATDHIQEMIDLISKLIEKGFAYQADGNVFFSVEKFKEYGKLSKRNLDEMKAGARVEVDEKKDNPLDFALWKAGKLGEPFWESPWGRGRPGWHIECSAMSQKYLGETFDIHGGGRDLIFPHHENEIAQSEAVTGKPFARYWIHNGFVNINKEKMSKSLGNILTIKEILKEWHPEVIRLFLLSSHYRSSLDFSFESLSEAKIAINRIYVTLKELKESLSRPTSNKNEVSIANLEKYHKIIDSFKVRFEEAMDDDFNTAQALGYFYELQKNLNSLLNLTKDGPSEEIRQLFEKALSYFSELGWIFGLFREDPADYLEKEKREGLKRLDISEEEIERLIKERDKARKQKDWKKADEIRAELLKKGIILEDSQIGTQWRISLEK